MPRLRKSSLLFLALLTVSTAVEAAPFTYNVGDLTLGFRMTNSTSTYDVVVNLGPATNYVTLPYNTVTNISTYVASVISPDAFAGLTNVSWSVEGEVNGGSIFNGWPNNTLWVTVPRVSGATPAQRAKNSTQQAIGRTIDSLQNGAVHLSSTESAGPDNTVSCVVENLGNDATKEDYGLWIEDPNNTQIGDLISQYYGPGILNPSGGYINLENITPSPFTTAVVSDLYELQPTGAPDPHTGQSSGSGYNAGYFTFNTSGTMTFTRAAMTVPAPTPAFTGGPTNIFVTQSVTLTDASTGSPASWTWNFGDGTSVTNLSNASVMHTYDAAGTYAVSLTVTNSGGSNTSSQSSYVTVDSFPQLSNPTLNNTNLIFSGSSCPAGAQYRIFASTNVAAPITDTVHWKPIYTNWFLSDGSFNYTNHIVATNPAVFLRLVSP